MTENEETIVRSGKNPIRSCKPANATTRGESSYMIMDPSVYHTIKDVMKNDAIKSIDKTLLIFLVTTDEKMYDGRDRHPPVRWNGHYDTPITHFDRFLVDTASVL